MLRLRSLRERRGFSQKEFAAEMDLPTATYNQYETGKRTPDIEMLMRFADYFSVTVDFLIGHDTPASPPVSSFSLTPHEQALIEAYRNHPALCSAVDRLLEVAPLSPEDEANARTVSAVVEAVLDIKKEGVLTK